MYLFYAAGGGLGHISRTVSFIRHLGLDSRQVYLLSNSSYARPPFIPSELNVIPLVPEVIRSIPIYQNFLLKNIRELHIREIYLDAFPGGLMGEWNDFPESESLEFYYLARILKWNAYATQHITQNPVFQKTYLFEPIEGKHQDFVKAHSREVIPLTLNYPLVPLPENILRQIQDLKKSYAEIWLILHSEPQQEVEELYQYALETALIQGIQPFFILHTQTQPFTQEANMVFWQAIHPTYALFPWVDRIVSACGFNTIQQTRTFRHKHLFLPFPRKYDDQFQRARMLREKRYDFF